MKKFLSLVLALVMTMSLVTISAGATEYKDLTDKDEIQYEEAVAVLNRLGIITGYSDGSFQPKKELTRGAAAKIIVSLLIGTEAASNLVASSAPYTDVPVNHTFAGVISFCKTSNIINGYQDGSFKPDGSLSGFAFSKMLLGALGYKGELEGFTGAGWNMKVAALGNEAGLFDRLSFKGNETVNREQACQLALNTLKATLVEYSGGMNVTNGNQTVVVNPNRSYKTSNQDFATNINAKTAANSSEYYTVEFGEEHFVDLRLEHDKKDPTDNDLGQPSAEWSYKKVTIGTYALEPDFRYTELVAHNDNSSTDASKVRALGLNGYEVNGSTQLWLNGYASSYTMAKVSEIADFTDNGTVVEVYVSETDADLITDVVVIQSALAEVKRIGSDYVTLGKYDTDGADTHAPKEGYNREAFDVANDKGLAGSKTYNDIQAEDRGYSVLSGLKAGDKVVVVPVAEDHGNARFDIWEAYVPETVTGALTRVDTYGSSASNRGTIGLTVGGTSYKAAEWNKDIIEIDGEAVKVTKKDVTLTLDKYGNALLAEDVGKTEEYMVVGYYYDSLIDGRLVKFVHGWDMNGNEVDLNLGRDPQVGAGDAEDYAKPGDLVRYENATSGSADWLLKDGSEPGNDAKIYAVNHGATANTYQITAYNTRVALTEASGRYGHNTKVNLANPIDVASGIKFIYVEFNDDHEVESVEVRSGVQAASNQELRAYHGGTATDGVFLAGTGGQWDTAQAYVSGENDGADNKNNASVKAVVIKRESNTAISSNLLYIRDYLGSAQKSDSTGKIIYGYTVVMNTADGLAGEAKTIYSYENLSVGDFASYSEVQNDQVSDFYKLREHTSHFDKTTTTFVAKVSNILKSNDNIIVLESDSYKAPDGNDVDRTDPSKKPAVGTIVYNSSDNKQTGEFVDRVRVSGKTQWVDLTTNHIASTKDLKDFKDVKLAMVVNDNVESDGFRDVAMIIVQEATRKDGSEDGSSSVGGVTATVKLGSSGRPVVEFEVAKPAWAADDATATVSVGILVDGVQADAATTATTGGKVSALGTGTYREGTVLGVGTPTITWDKVKVTTGATLPEGLSIKAGSTSIGVGANKTLTVTMEAGKYDGAKVTVKQGDTVLVNAEALSDGDNDLTLTNVVEGYAIEVSFSDVETKTYALTIGATMSNWTVGGTTADKYVAGTPVSITFTQDAGQEAPFKALADGATLTLATDYNSTGLPGGAIVELTTQGVAAVAETFTYSDVAATLRAQVANATNFQPTADEAAGINDGGPYYSDDNGDDTPWTAAAGTAIPATGVYTKTGNGDAVAAKKAVLTITFDMPAAPVNFSAFALVP
ncbi:MAG: hypothetical protein HFG01_01515 [Oscillibacter sp.]|nr:hypothetical protein [Oscillibacter sp.]